MLTKRQIDALANRIVTNLFTNGVGEKAERLLLWKDSEKRDLGGWGFNSVLFEVRNEIRIELAKASARGAKKAASKMTPAQRKKRATKAAKARWDGK